MATAEEKERDGDRVGAIEEDDGGGKDGVEGGGGRDV